MVIRRLNKDSEPQASIESDRYTIQYVQRLPLHLSCSNLLIYGRQLHAIPEHTTLVLPDRSADMVGPSYLLQTSLIFLTICDRSYPRKLAFTYLSDLATEFTTTYPSSAYLSPSCRPYAFVDFDTFIQRTKKTYQDSRATQNLDKLNDELRDVTKVMTKNIEDLLYRGDSLERMGEMSGRLREDSKKYRKAAVRINWDLLLKQYGPFVGVGVIILVFLGWRFL